MSARDARLFSDYLGDRGVPRHIAGAIYAVLKREIRIRGVEVVPQADLCRDLYVDGKGPSLEDLVDMICEEAQIPLFDYDGPSQLVHTVEDLAVAITHKLESKPQALNDQ